MGLDGYLDDAILVEDADSYVLGGAGLLIDAVLVEAYATTILISDIDPDEGYTYSVVTITGTGFLAAGGTVEFDAEVALISSWSDTEIVCIAPDGLSVGAVTVTVTNSGGHDDTVSWTKLADPVAPGAIWIDDIVPDEGVAGSSVTITGGGFYDLQVGGTVTFGGYPATITSWANDEIVCTAPLGPSGAVTVTVQNTWGMSASTTWTYLTGEVTDPAPAQTFSLAFVSSEFVRTDGEDGEIYLEINDGRDYAVMLNTFRPRPAPRTETYSDSPFADYSRVAPDLDKLQNLMIPLSIRVRGLGRQDRDDKVADLLHELRRDNTLWLAHTVEDTVKFYLCHPPADILTDTAWEREYQDRDIGIVECELPGREPFGKWVELTLDETHYGMEVSSPPEAPEAIVSIVVPPDDIETEAPTPMDIHVDFETLGSPAPPAPTNILVGQRLKYSEDFDPIREFGVGEEHSDGDRYNGRYREVDADAIATSEIWSDGFEDYTGTPGLNDVDFDHWDETRSGHSRIVLSANPNTGVPGSVYEGATNLYTGMTFAQLMSNPSFESWTGTWNYPVIEGWWHQSDTSVTMWEVAARTGTWGVLLRFGFMQTHPTSYTAGRTYTFGVHARTSASWHPSWLTIQARYYNAAHALIGTADIRTTNVTSSSWRFVAGRVTSAPVGTTSMAFRLIITQGSPSSVLLIDDATLFRDDYAFAEQVDSEDISVDDSLGHKVSWKARQGHPARKVVVWSVVSALFYDAADAYLGYRYLYIGNLFRSSTAWNEYVAYINPNEFPATTDYMKLRITRTGTVVIGATEAGWVPNHHFDDFLVETGYTMETSFPVSSTEGRYLPTMGLAFSGSTAHDEVSVSRLLATSGGIPITGAQADDSVDVDSDNSWVDISCADERLATISIPAFRISENADKSEITEVHRLSLDPSFDVDLYHDYYALIPVDRSFVELETWTADYLILDSHSGAVLASLDGTVDTAQVHTGTMVRGVPRFVMHPEGVNMVMLCVTQEGDDDNINTEFVVRLRYRPRYRL